MMSMLLINLPDNARLRRVFQTSDFERLAGMGEIVRFDPTSGSVERFHDLLGRADAMLTGWGSRSLTHDDWAAASAGRSMERPLLVAHAAGSIRHLVPRELLSKGVRLTQSASGMAPSVAQFAVGLMILGLRQTMGRTAALRAGQRTNETEPYRDLRGLTVGLWGLSQVGRRVPPLLAPFGCRVIAYDPYWSTEDAAALGVELVDDLDELVRHSDVLSLHAPVTDATRRQLDARRTALLQPGSVVVDQEALFARAQAGEIQLYTDVTEPEPLPTDHLAWQCPGIFITPHIAGPTSQALRQIGTHAIDEIERFLKGEPLKSEITPDRYDILA
ncbi:MAG: hydroxyacid dehydrogenase [Armatimonadota bacterium]